MGAISSPSISKKAFWHRRVRSGCIAVDGPFGDSYIIGENQPVFILERAGFCGKFDNLMVIEELKGYFCGGGEVVVNLLSEQLGGEHGIDATGKSSDRFEKHGVLTDLFHFVDFFELDVVAEQCAEFGGEGELFSEEAGVFAGGYLAGIVGVNTDLVNSLMRVEDNFCSFGGNDSFG